MLHIQKESLLAIESSNVFITHSFINVEKNNSKSVLAALNLMLYRLI